MRPEKLPEEFVDGGVRAKTFSLFRGRRGRRIPSKTNTTNFPFSVFLIILLADSFTCKNQALEISPFSLAFTHVRWQETASVCKQTDIQYVNNGEKKNPPSLFPLGEKNKMSTEEEHNCSTSLGI